MKRTPPGRIVARSLLLPALLVLLCHGIVAWGAGNLQISFSTPETAAQALVDALRGDDAARIADILGPGSEPLISSGDAVADRMEREDFLKLYQEQHRIDLAQPDKALLMVGSQEYPVPIPVVKRGESWLFDTEAGQEEILDRRVGRNELQAIVVAHAYVEAQREYASRVRGPGRPAEYAQQLLSTPGRKDGLYWERKEGEEESPMGALVAQAAREGYAKPQVTWPAPFHGYYFRILKGQGGHASGGAMDYLVKGRMVRGFALVAYPARYGNSGIMTFMVNHDGVVYQKDLGPDTARIASSLHLFDPGKGWTEVGGDEEHLPTVSDVN